MSLPHDAPVAPLARNIGVPDLPNLPPCQPRARTVPGRLDNPALGRSGQAWPRLSEDLTGPKHPNRCQKCGRDRDALNEAGEMLVAWQECAQDGRDTPEDIYLLLCTHCNKEGTTKTGRRQRGIVARHKRFYHQLANNAPTPGVMHLCVNCAWRDGTHCSHPDKKPNGGEGLLVEFPTPTTQHFTCSPRSMGGYYHFYKPATRCAGREEEYTEDADLDDSVWESSKDNKEFE